MELVEIKIMFSVLHILDILPVNVWQFLILCQCFFCSGIHSYVKDITLFMAILLAIGISWFACLHHRYSQTQVKKMMKDLESLQKAEDALKKLSKE